MGRVPLSFDEDTHPEEDAQVHPVGSSDRVGIETPGLPKPVCFPGGEVVYLPSPTTSQGSSYFFLSHHTLSWFGTEAWAVYAEGKPCQMAKLEVSRGLGRRAPLV